MVFAKHGREALNESISGEDKKTTRYDVNVLLPKAVFFALFSLK
jgi:hypothetical protein